MGPTPGHLEHQAARLRELARRAALYADDADVLMDDVLAGATEQTWTGQFARDTNDRLGQWRREQRAGAGLLRAEAARWRQIATDYDRYAAALRAQERERQEQQASGPR